MAAPEAVTSLQYGQIYLGSRTGLAQGPLRVTPHGITWKTSNGSKTVDIRKDDLEGLYWTKSSRGCYLGVRVRDGPTTNFIGFREKDVESLKDFCQQHLGREVQELPLSTSGRNWGALAINNGSLMFMVDGKVALEVPLRDVSSAQESKGDVVMEFHVDDTAADDRQDVVTEMAFHVPATNTDFAPSEKAETAAKALLEHVLQYTDAGAASTDDAVCEFADCAVLNPRGRFEISMHLSFLSLAGQTQDFKIRYTSIQRLFILPKSNTPHTLVVVSLDPPIRKGQTYYTHVLCQFPSHDEVTMELEITPEQLAAKNEKCGGKLDTQMTGPVCEVFARALRGLSGAKISRPGAFRNSANDGSSIRCSYKADDGHLYPLDRAFFYVHKPPMLLPFDEVESVEFARQGGGVVSSRTFDLVVRMKNGVEHQFRNINRTEWQTLLDFFNSKKLRIENLHSAAQGPGGMGRALDVDDDIDPGMRRAEAEIDTEEDDEDFDLGAAGSGSDSEDISSDADVDSSDAEMVPEEGITVASVMKKKGKEKRARDEEGGEEKPKKVKAAPGEPKVKKEPKAEPGVKAEGGPSVVKKEKKEPKEPKEPKGKGKGKEKEEGDGKKKPRKKKDPNAPKKNLSAFMFFSNDQRNKIKEENPGIAFGEVGKLLGEKWKTIPAEDKAKYEKLAAADKERYAQAMAAYKASSGGAAAEEEEGDASEGGDE